MGASWLIPIPRSLLYRYCNRCERSLSDLRPGPENPHRTSFGFGSDDPGIYAHQETDSLQTVMEGLAGVGTGHFGAVLIQTAAGTLRWEWFPKPI